MTARTKTLFVQKDHLIVCRSKEEKMNFVVVGGARQEAAMQMRDGCVCKCCVCVRARTFVGSLWGVAERHCAVSAGFAVQHVEQA